MIEFEQVIDSSPSYLSRYVSAFGSTLLRPGVFFAPSSSCEPGAFHSHAHEGNNRQLVAFTGISIAVGLALSSVAADSRIAAVMLVALIVGWLLFSIGVHVIARLCGGEATFVVTAAVSLQVSGVMYVLINSVSLVARIFSKIPGIDALLSLSALQLFAFPAQYGLLAIYIPLAVQATHRLKQNRTAIVLMIGWIAGVTVISSLAVVFVVLTSLQW